MRRRTTNWRRQIYRDLKANGLISSKVIEQFFDPDKNMFLPDRFIKGECPNCHAKDQYGDNCEVCSKVYSPTDLINPYSALSRRDAGAEKLRALLLQAVRRALHGLPQGMDAHGRAPADRGAEQDQRMAGAGRGRQGGAGRLGYQPRRALLRHRDPGCARQVFLRVAGRAGRLPGLAQELSGQDRAWTTTSSSPIPTWSSTTSSARTSSPSTRCSGRRCCISPAARCPTRSSCTASSR